LNLNQVYRRVKMTNLTLDRRLRADDLFDSLGSEDEQDPEGRTKVIGSSLKTIVTDFERLLQEYDPERDDIDEIIKRYAPENIAYEDIQKFMKLETSLEEHENFFLAFGYYINSLIERCSERKIKLDFSNYSTAISDIGSGLTGRSLELTASHVGFDEGLANHMRNSVMRIKGYAGKDLGYDIEDCEIYVEGDTGSFVGTNMGNSLIKVSGNVSSPGNSMRSGLIIVEGNCKDYVGHSMNNGTVVINGDLTQNCLVGYAMTGGEVHLNGKIGQISPKIIGGNVYHKGRQIVKEGKKIR